jgi:phosphate transport system substrate-binding protein
LRNTFRVVGMLVALVAAAATLTGCQSGDSINVVGSDTTFDVMKRLTTLYNESGDTGGDKAFNTPPFLNGDTTFKVDGDGNCGAITYNSSGNPPPNGSSAGVSALTADTQGCVDAARSSRDRRSSDPANLEFYAFAKDGLSWAKYPSTCPGGDAGPAGCAPANLTQAQLKGIYICDQPGGLPKFTNWAQVGGDNEPIRRYLPQTGSGTLSFFETRILGLSSAQQGVVDDTNCATRPTRVQENTGTEVPTADRYNAIVPYSFAQWRAQANGAQTDVRAGAILGSINGVAPSQTSVTNNTFLGVRYVYNVLKTSSPSYDRARNFVGVAATSEGGNGFICSNNGDVQSALTTYGFVTLSLAPAGPGLPSSRCRKNPPPL